MGYSSGILEQVAGSWYELEVVAQHIEPSLRLAISSDMPLLVLEFIVDCSFSCQGLSWTGAVTRPPRNDLTPPLPPQDIIDE